MFADRREAGRRLAPLLAHLREEDPIVLGLPRGGVPVAAEVAVGLGAALDVILVRKLGVPFQPELAMGAIGEGGVRVVNDEVVAQAGVSPEVIADVEEHERTELERRAERYRAGRASLSLKGRVVVVVDDGLATGATAKAACEVVRAAGAQKIVLAVPVAPEDWTSRLSGAADEFVCVETPEPFFGVGQFYRWFAQTTDEEVSACLTRASRGHVARPHTADVILEAWGTDAAACFEEVVAALVETCADVSGAVPVGHHDVVLPSGPNDSMLLGLLDEVIFVLDVGEAMPVSAAVSETTAGGLSATLTLAARDTVSPTGSVPKAVSRSGLLVEESPDRVRCRVLIDV